MRKYFTIRGVRVIGRSVAAAALIVAATAALILAGTAALIVEAAAAASAPQQQSPRFGPDTAQFRLTSTNNSTIGVGGMNMSLESSMMLLVTLRITQRGVDTLLVHATVDSMDMKAANPDGNADLTMSPAPFGKGDTAVLLISATGEPLQRLAGIENLGHTIEGLTGIRLRPNLAAGSSWESGAEEFMGAVPFEGDGEEAIRRLLQGRARITYVGEVDSDAGRVWKFEHSGAASNLVAGSARVHEMKSSGEALLDLRGRFVRSSLSIHLSFEAPTDGMMISGTATGNTTTVRVR